MDPSKFRPETTFKHGFIANTTEGEKSNCRFGGVDWSATGPRPGLGHPTLKGSVLEL